ncbi:hypothetical protein [Acidimangrovimonas sediminis]|uniref:hypothetical protein n=1 Tax=Acidimangrovimonas sediminis TaxID=2056283 RepID=UPI000C808810|nr:hypothetical protein [Acidimangrovimonas sediminis]
MAKLDDARRCYRITLSDRAADAASVTAMSIRWLETQGQDVWGHAILGAAGEPTREEERFLFWMVDQKIDRANAIRLFWKLYRPGLQYGPATESPGAAVVLAALRALIARFELGSFPRGQTGIGRREARFYRLSWQGGRRALGRAAREGTPAFDIPKALFQPQPGRALEPQPTIRPVGPAPEWMDTPEEGRFALAGQKLRRLVGDLSRAEAARMQARLQVEARRARLRYSAAAVVAAAGIVVWSAGPVALMLPI